MSDFIVKTLDPNVPNIFAILDKNELNHLPLKVYGLLKVEGKNYKQHTVAECLIATECISREEINKCKDLASTVFFKID